ncbi:hypothetical protein F5880DRAFT_1604394 [Lentinula raphanica]|nr:hypothetical protein F5880DRAFT_1604394 [Lentinula raphanica]
MKIPSIRNLVLIQLLPLISMSTFIRVAASPVIRVPTAHNMELEGRGLPTRDGVPALGSVCYFLLTSSSIERKLGTNFDPNRRLTIENGGALDEQGSKSRRFDCGRRPPTEGRKDDDWLCVLESRNIEAYKKDTPLINGEFSADSDPTKLETYFNQGKGEQYINYQTLMKETLGLQARCYSPTLVQEMKEKNKEPFPDIPWKDWGIQNWNNQAQPPTHDVGGTIVHALAQAYWHPQWETDLRRTASTRLSFGYIPHRPLPQFPNRHRGPRRSWS